MDAAEDAKTKRILLAACAVLMVSIVFILHTFNEDAESGEEDTDIEESDKIAKLGHEDDESGEEDTDTDKNDSIAKFAEALMHVAKAIRSNYVHWTQELMEKLLQLENEGYAEMILERAFDALYKNEVKARSFMVRPRDWKLEWMRKFVDGEVQN